MSKNNGIGYRLDANGKLESVSLSRGSISTLWSERGSDPMLDIAAFIERLRAEQGAPPLSPHEHMIIERIKQDMREHPEAWIPYMQKLVREAEHEQAAEDHQASLGSEQEEGSHAG